MENEKNNEYKFILGRLTPLLFFFGGGPFFKVNFLENCTSNEAQTKLKTLSVTKRSFFQPFKQISKMVQDRQKVIKTASAVVHYIFSR